MFEFEIKLLTSRVAVDQSLVAGDHIFVGNDEAWRMINAGTGELVGEVMPEIPKLECDFIAADAAAEKAKSMPLKSVRPDLDEQAERYEEKIQNLMSDAEAALAEQRDIHTKELEARDSRVAELESELAAAAEKIAGLESDLAEAKKPAPAKSASTSKKSTAAKPDSDQADK